MKKQKKLVLAKETLRHLGAGEFAHAVGGTTHTAEVNCTRIPETSPCWPPKTEAGYTQGTTK